MVEWRFRMGGPADAGWMAELRAVVMRPDLTRLGRFDPRYVRRRFLDAYAPDLTRVIVVDGADAGLIAVRPDGDVRWIEHFYLDPSLQGRGVGGAVLACVLAEEQGPFRLNVLRGSGARRLYERHGFVEDSADEVDVFMTRAS